MSANFWDGAVRFGPSVTACSTAIQGSIRWNDTQKVHEYCNGVNWTTLSPPCSAQPDDFTIPNVTGAASNTLTTSSIIQITGIGCSNADVSITGASGTPEYRICSDSGCSTVVRNWSATAGTIANNQFIQLRLTSETNSVRIRNADLTIGGYTTRWRVTTQDLGTYKYAFVVVRTPNFGGIAAADALCNSEADNNNLGGTYMAWIANNASDDPDSRFTTKATIPYRRVDLTLIANNWTDLTDGSITNRIDRQANGVGVACSAPASNVATNGTAINNDVNTCNGWQSCTGSGHRGNTCDSGGGWTNAGNSTCCSIYSTLYCFQQ